MPVESLLQHILSEPSPDDLWRLHPHLLALDKPGAEPARELARQFYCYLGCLHSKLTSKQYSMVAAGLAAGSVGILALQEMMRAAAEDRAHLIRDLLVGGLAETMELSSTVQHVKAWDTEFKLVHEEAIWHLYAELWQLSAETQPGLSHDKRAALIDSLLSAVRDSNTDNNLRAALIIRLFQVLLVLRLTPLLTPAQAAASE
ncbi:MAG: hypothetical protein JXJ20_08220 [Anaerolineae bacterium]|jgi:hypothetical protein|nr:hypothetical protein [Anaerolineae bacterium]